MLNEALRLIRIFHDIKQNELAEKLKISKSHLSEVESGKKKATLSLVERYSEIFDIPVSSIMFFSENMNSNENLEKFRILISSKIISLMNFIAERSDRHVQQ